MRESRETAYIWKQTSLETSWSLAAVITLTTLALEGYIRPVEVHLLMSFFYILHTISQAFLRVFRLSPFICLFPCQFP